MRVIFVGIDALDREIIDRYIDHLPTFARLKAMGARIPLRSVFPPDSDTAWASIYTATDPATHGILNFTDALSKSAEHQARDVDNGPLRGKTFWDHASAAGKRVCLLHPHIGFPPWEVNGVFVGRSSVSDRVEVVPQRRLPDDFDLARLNLPKGFPDHRNLGKYVEHHRTLVDAQRELSVALVQEEPWDLFLTYSSSIDMVKHFFWSFMDEDDPNHPGETPWKHVIRDLYIQHDEWIRQLWDSAGSDAALVVVGDHGHGRRPSKVVHLNELLRRNGLLQPARGLAGPWARAIDAAKSGMVRAVGKLHLENLAAQGLKRLPSARKMFTAPPSIDWGQTSAYMSDLSGIKAYAYGGIRIRETLPPNQRLDIRQRIIHQLRSLRDPDTNQPIAEWVGAPEEIYSGPHIKQYPDVLYQFLPQWGASAKIGAGLFGTSPSHAIVPGTHRMDTPEFLVHGSLAIRPSGVANMMDVGSFILRALDLSPGERKDGLQLTDGGK